jgi:hypothetical protein
MMHAAPVAPNILPRRSVLTPGGHKLSSRRAWHRKRLIRPRKPVLVGLVVVLLGAVVLWGAPRAWSELQRGWEAVFTPQEPSQQLVPAPSLRDGDGDGTAVPATDGEASGPAKEPAPVDRPAPRAAGPVTEVTIDLAEARCVGGEQCPVRVDVHLRPSAAPRPVNWSLHIVDRCTGDTQTGDGVSMTAQAGWRQVYGISRPTLPEGTALAVIAVTESPARAASEPLSVPARDALC